MSDKTCSHCRSQQFRRVNRVGFLEHRLLTRLGYFPWECILCRRRMYFRDEGRRAMQQRTSAPPVDVVQAGDTVGATQVLHQ